MGRTILTEVKGWTPLIHALVAKYGLITAAVYGRVWGYCQMSDGVCRASHERIADDLRLDRKTVLEHIRILVNDGYLKNLTPGMRNRPNTYADTGKAGLRSTIFAEHQGKSEDEIDQLTDQKAVTGVVKSDSGQTEVSSNSTPGVEINDTRCGNKRHPGVEINDMNKQNKPLNRQENKEVVGAAAPSFDDSRKIRRLYENNIGPLTPMLAEAIDKALKIYPLDWIAMAIETAVRNEGRSWAYVEAILKRWQAQGFSDQSRPKATTQRQAAVNDTLARLEARREKATD